ncbi:HNH endonuclease family protein [Helicobacter muridarum]|uniref:RloF n=1 Tax=Helicobacter muridarum TaxID=216 RepID=A0A377PTN9_9HELI|nr:HNH endonuclease family protein [Helicobacter muridarum]STQ86298.1 RloF [Helicobacter muridarum]
MHYENYLREQDSKTKSYTFTLKDVKKPQIEHIAPQTENGEKLASGYCEYDDDFRQKHLHCIGNLLLIGASQNSAIGNNPLKDKLASYENTPLIQQRQIKDFAVNEKWEKDSITKRHEEIKDFVLETWSF